MGNVLLERARYDGNKSAERYKYGAFFSQSDRRKSGSGAPVLHHPQQETPPRRGTKRAWLRERLHEGHVFRKLDANILPGQIKNNLNFRVCGKVDNALSQIILDNTNAADQLPKDARGRFITGGRNGIPGLPVRRGAVLRLETAPMGRKRKGNDYGTEIPYHAVESLSRILLPEIQAFFKSEKGKREFSEWKTQREKGYS